MARCVRNGESIENNFDIVDAARNSCTGQSMHWILWTILIVRVVRLAAQCFEPASK